MTNDREDLKIVDERDPNSIPLKLEVDTGKQLSSNNQKPTNRNFLRRQFVTEHPYAEPYILPEEKTTGSKPLAKKKVTAHTIV